MTDLHQRLTTLLFLVPYVVRHRGVPLRELAERLGISEDDLHKELDFLLMVGRPPFQPNDFLDIYQEGGRVYVDLHQSLEKPPRLTVFEALALASAARIFADDDGDPAMAVRMAVDKVVRSLPKEAKSIFDELSDHYLIDAGGKSVVPHMDVLRKAAEESLELEIEHYSASRDEVTTRVVQPYGLHHRAGVWYLAAFCCHRDAERVFRLSRIRAARLTDRIFDPPVDFDVAGFVDRALTVPVAGERQIVIRFTPAVARWIQERWGPEYLNMESDGSVVARLHDVSEEYILAYVASFGGEAEIIEPETMATRLREQAKAALAAYE